MNKQIISLSLIVACTASCSNDDEAVSTQLAQPAVTVGEVTSHSIAFAWQAVDGARQYGYRVISSTGEEADAGVTTETTLALDAVEHATTYTLQLTAFPVNGSALASPTISIDVRTPFCPQVVDADGTYTSYLNNGNGESWTATLSEERSAADTFGTFTLAKFWGRASAPLIFTVGEDKKIKIQNAAEYDEKGWAKVATGRPQAALKHIYIDEASSKFDCNYHTLTYTARLAGSDETQSETFTW